MPARIKGEPDLVKFKSELKTWAKEIIDNLSYNLTGKKLNLFWHKKQF